MLQNLKAARVMYKALIVDDNKIARVMLSEMLRKIDTIELVGEFEDAPSSINRLKKDDIDISISGCGNAGNDRIGIIKSTY